MWLVETIGFEGNRERGLQMVQVNGTRGSIMGKLARAVSSGTRTHIVFFSVGIDLSPNLDSQFLLRTL